MCDVGQCLEAGEVFRECHVVTDEYQGHIALANQLHQQCEEVKKLVQPQVEESRFLTLCEVSLQAHLMVKKGVFQTTKRHQLELPETIV